MAGVQASNPGLQRTGWTALAGKKLIEWSTGSKVKLSVLLTLGSGLLSGFVSNTGTVATLLPVSVGAAWNIGTLPSKVLLPVAFGSNTGGLLTLTGTPPNIIVSNSLIEQGFEGFSFFEFGLIGIPLSIVTILYFRFLGNRLLPNHQINNRPLNIESEFIHWVETYKLDEDFWPLRIRSSSPLVNTTIGDWLFDKNYDLSITRLKKKFSGTLNTTSPYIEFPSNQTLLEYSDIITVRGEYKSIDRFMRDFNLALQPNITVEESLEDQIISQEMGMAEVIVVPKSDFVGRKIKLGEYLKRFNIQLLAASRNNKPIKNKEVQIKAGDSFLIRGSWKDINGLSDLYKNIVVLGKPESVASNIPTLNTKSYISLFAFVLMVALMVFKIVPGAIDVLIAAGLVVLCNCIPITQVYKSISWVSVVMIAAMIPMGTDLQKTGLAQMAADSLVQYKELLIL